MPYTLSDSEILLLFKFFTASGDTKDLPELQGLYGRLYNASQAILEDPTLANFGPAQVSLTFSAYYVFTTALCFLYRVYLYP